MSTCWPSAAPRAHCCGGGSGLGLAGRGRALRIPLGKGLAEEAGPERALEVLASIKVEDDLGLTGCGPLALGALPFDRRGPAEPDRAVGHRRLRRRRPPWLTTIAPIGDAPAVRLGTVDRLPGPSLLIGSRSCRSGPTPTGARRWHDAVGAIRSGDFDKVVLAREVLVEANRPFVPADVLRRLYSLYPSCMVFAMHGFVGASPELLVSPAGRQVTSHPLAGTVARQRRGGRRQPR